jgi:crotonobetainyl-CoA:carnitine CoA-transferase CaiB-like acyl-CoA transferase
VQAEAGLCAITGTASDPARVGVSVCDIAAGERAHAAILQALLARHSTGIGRRILVSLFDSIADWMNVPILQYLYGQRVAMRAGVNHPTLAPYGAYICGDGAKVILSVQNEREWTAFCELFLRMPEVSKDERFRDNLARVRNRVVLDELINSMCADLTEAEAHARLEASGIAYGRLNGLEGAAMHPHLRFMDVKTARGNVHVIAPAAMSESESPIRAVPAVDQHGTAIRAEFAED